MLPALKAIHARVRDFHAQTFKDLLAASSEITRSEDIREFADFTYAMRQTLNLLEDLAKEVRKKQNLTEIIVCQKAVQQDLMGAIETEYVKCTPKPRVGVSLPGFTKERERFDQMMVDLGIPEALWKGLERPIAKIDYPAVTEFVSDELAAGRVMPDAFRSMKRTSLLGVTIYAKKEIDA